MCCKKTSRVELHFEKKTYVCIPRSFLVINVCNKGNTLCSPCILYRNVYIQYIQYIYTRSVRKVSDRIFLCEHLMDYNLARLREPTLNLSAHA